MKTEIAIILISKNQAWNIARLIESVINDCSNNVVPEILLVDSASVDETTQIACKYPIKVIRLQSRQHQDDAPLTPAAGRFIGFKNTESEFVLFLDGDMELYPGWLNKALEIMRNKSEVATITGSRIDLPQNSLEKDKPERREYTQDHGTVIKKTGGASLYRRSVLDEVGSFNPYLHSDEEPDLCIRVRHAGYQILKLKHPIAYHYSDPINSLLSKFKRWKRKLYLGAGQNLRYHFGDKIFWQYVKERGFGLIPLFGILIGLVTLLLYINFSLMLPIQHWLLAFTFFILFDFFRKRSVHKTMVSLLERLFIAEGTIRGFLMKPRSPANYKNDFDRLQ